MYFKHFQLSHFETANIWVRALAHAQLHPSPTPMSPPSPTSIAPLGPQLMACPTQRDGMDTVEYWTCVIYLSTNTLDTSIWELARGTAKQPIMKQIS
jgi:hypothetical protein